MNTPHPPPSTPSTTAPARRLWLARDDAPTEASSDQTGTSFDALTDLFLGEVPRPRRPDGLRRDAGARSTPPSESAPEAGAPVLRLAGHDSDESGVNGQAESAAGTSPRHAEPRVQRPFVECVVVGNLPVLASAWASEYVREVARAAERPVAYLRVQAGFVTVELVGGTAEQEGVPTPVLPPVTDLEQSLRLAATITGRWVIRVDHADEAAAAARASVQLVTLITGADEAARVHAYASLKELGERLPKVEAGSSEKTGPVVRVAVMSAAEPDAEAAGRRLVETVKQFLGRDVQHAVCSSKIRASRSAQLLFNGKVEQPTSQVLQQLEQVFQEAGVEVESTVVLAPQVRIPTPAAALATEVVAESVPVVDAEVEPRGELIAAANVGDGEEIGSRRREPAAELRGTREEPAAERRGTHAANRDLAAFVAGVSAVPMRCPYAESVQLAIGEDGVVHLLGESGGPGSDDAVLSGLMVAAAWVESHAGLLRTVAPGLEGRARVLHLFTATPKASRRLLETSVRVHVLAPVRAGAGWCCVELN